ncbi:MAG: hypothetical protein ACTSPV_00640 [Candidatus Hodarchaeales archaeon]
MVNDAVIIKCDYEGTKNPIYIGRANPNTSETDEGWQIYKYIYNADGNVISRLYAEGNYMFRFKWSLRKKYTYK